MKHTTVFLIITAALLMVSLAAWQYIQSMKIENAVVNIYKDNICVKSIDLSEVESAYEFTVGTDNSTNTIRVENGRYEIW